MKWLFAFLIALSCNVSAQLVPDGFFGVQYHSLGVYGRQVVAPVYHQANIDKDSTEFVWMQLTEVFNHADTDGESVAITGRCFKYGLAPCWGGVFETHCLNRGSGCFSVELDLVGEGGVANPLSEAVQIVLGRSRLSSSTDPAYLHAVIEVVPQGGRLNEVKLDYGYRQQVPCEVNCVQIPSGSKISFDGGNTDAEMKFDPKTGYMGFWSSRLNQWMWAVNMSTGHIIQNAKL